MSKIIPFQLHIRPVLPTILGNIDYKKFEESLYRIAEILSQSGIEELFVEKSTDNFEEKQKAAGIVKTKESLLKKHQHRARVGFRSMILKSLLGESYRAMSIRLAECQLFQWFCHIDTLSVVQVPSKSELQSYVSLLPEEELRVIIGSLLLAASTESNGLELKKDIELENLWLDSTCVKSNIHFPVDWLLLRDAIRTLMKATAVIRKHGLKVRMQDPSVFLKQINCLSIQMTQGRRTKNGKQNQKKTLGQMKKLVAVVREHAIRHRDALDAHWKQTDWSRNQAQIVIDRIDMILAQLPQAQRQAHERIIGERQIESKDKILSLYDTDVHVIVRGKAGAEVEFGNTLFLAENRDGLIVDWKLFQDIAPHDSKILKDSIARVESSTKAKVKSVCTDRAFHSPANSALLEKKEIFNAVAPKSPIEFKQKNTDQIFSTLQKRRSSTEARVAIFKNVFLGKPFRAKGFTSKSHAINWSVLAHNLWLLARLPKKIAALKIAA